MMKKNIFTSYSKYYNLLYADKDYKSEVEYVNSLIKQYSIDCKSILDLGCGTGKHDFILAEKGYDITGIDLSEEMIAIAKTKKSKYNINFRVADVRNYESEHKYDVVLSLFHVASYQTSNLDIIKYFNTANKNLVCGVGIFIFDFWYGPAVLNDRPNCRLKKMENDQIRVRRFTEPVLHENQNIVDVNFEVFIEDKKTKTLTEFTETHKMRYFFYPELENLLRQSGFSILKCYKWMTKSPLNFNSWYGIIIAQK